VSGPFEFALTIAGPPTGKGRPRHGQGRTWTPQATVLAESEIRHAWENAGQLRLPDGPIAVRVELVVARPAGHRRRDGTLSAEGLRRPEPDNRKPDVDNALKLVLDALNGRAWRDDVQVVDARVTRSWSATQVAWTRIEATTFPRPADARAEAA